MSPASIVMTVVLGLTINECCEISPWAARALVKWSARCRYANNPERAGIRAIELAALIDVRPGKIFKLLTACGFVTAALCSQLMARLRRTSAVDAGGTATAAPELDGGVLEIAELVQGAANGNRQAWERLVEQYARLVWSITADYHLAESVSADVAETAWLRLLEHIDRIEYPDRVGAWLAATVRNECLRRVTARKIMPDVSE